MALTADVPIKLLEGDFADYPMETNVKIFEGALVSIDITTGYAKPLTATATDIFAGVAYRFVDNTGGAAGLKKVKVRRGNAGSIYLEVAVTGATQATVGDPVYASDDSTYTMTAGTNKLVGKLAYFETAAICHVRLDLDV
jgi:hypothetical protein